MKRNRTLVEKLYFHTALLVSDPSELGPYMFPKPKIENVYEAWKPIDYGHPLVDPTIHYAPVRWDSQKGKKK